jgi:hypothetical protein
MFFYEGAAVNTWQQLCLLRRLKISMIVSMVESVLTQRKHHVAQSVITVPISLEEGKCGDKYDYFGPIILFSIELINMYIFQFFKIHYIHSLIFFIVAYHSV